MSYPLFVPPGELGQKTPREWSSTEARQFYRWQLGVLEERVRNMLTYFDEELTGDAEADLKRLGEKVASVVADAEFSHQAKTEPIVFKKGSRTLMAPPQTETEPKLTSAGLALGADMGLLVAKLLLEACGDKLRWTTLRRPKTEISYNLPVLTGFMQWPHLEPVRGSIAELDGVLHGERGTDIWFEMFEYWRRDCRPD